MDCGNLAYTAHLIGYFRKTRFDLYFRESTSQGPKLWHGGQDDPNVIFDPHLVEIHS